VARAEQDLWDQRHRCCCCEDGRRSGRHRQPPDERELGCAAADERELLSCPDREEGGFPVGSVLSVFSCS